MLHQDSAADWVPQNVSDAAQLRGRLQVEHPTASLHSFNGRFELWAPTPSISTPSSDEAGVTEGSDNAVVASVPVTLEVCGVSRHRLSLCILTHCHTQEVLLRGCKLKNSGSVVGVAVYTGRDTRIQRNARQSPRLKVGAYDLFLNVQVLALIVLQLAFCIALAVASYAFRREQRGAFYFEWAATGTGRSGNNAGNGFVFGSISFLTFWYVPGGVRALRAAARAAACSVCNHGDEENTTHVTIHGGGEIPTAWTDETQGRNLVSRSHGQG